MGWVTRRYGDRHTYIYIYINDDHVALQGFHSLVVPAVLVGTLGYASATFMSLAVGTWLKATVG